MAESSHMQLGSLIAYQLERPDMTIRDFFHMKAAEIEEQEEEERGGGFRKPTYRSTHYERTKNLPPSKLAEKMQANKERRQMKRMMRNMMKGRRNAK